jgi:glycosyltransferase involved in cell wall biosynthesis
VFRALATANAFATAGWDVTVLTIDRRTVQIQYGSDDALEKHVDSRVVVHRLKFPEPLRELDLSRWPRGRVVSDVAWSSAALRASRLDFPENVYGAWRRHLEGAAGKVHAAHPVDLTIGTANPNVDLVAGWYLHRRHGVPYVVDHRDSWSLDLYRDRRAFPADSRAGRWERRLLAGADEIWFVNEPIRSWYAREFPDRAAAMHVVANAYDGDVPGEVEAAREAIGRTALPVPEAAERGLTFGYLGTVYGPIPLRQALEGWRRARATDPLVARSRLEIHGRLGHYGVPDSDASALIAEFSGDGVDILGPVPKTEVASAYARLDVLLLILSSGRYVTSGKVFEYAATGLPVVSLHDPESAATSVMSGSPSWVAARSLDVDDLAAAISAGARLALDRTPARAAATVEWARRFERSQQLAPRIAALIDLVRRTDLEIDAEPRPAPAVRETGTVAAASSPGPRRVLLVVGSDQPADTVLAEAVGDAGLGRLFGASAEVDLVCRRAPSSTPAGVDHVHVARGDDLWQRLAGTPGYRNLAERADRSVPGRVLLSLSPADDGRLLWRAVRADAAAEASARAADVVVAVDRAANRTAWEWRCRGVAREAVVGVHAAARLLEAAGSPR